MILNIISRVLLATIRNLGSFPCPRCLIPKEKIPEVGTRNDDQRRETQRRVANNSLISKISTARTWIYNEGYRIKAAAVERLLSPMSLLPTVVCPKLLSPFPNLLCWVLECVYSSLKIWIWLPQYACGWFHARVRTWSMEGSLQASHSYSIRPRRISNLGV